MQQKFNEDWFEPICRHAFMTVQGRLQAFPVLYCADRYDYAALFADYGVARMDSLARQVVQDAVTHIGKGKQAYRWASAVAYQESLRFVLRAERVEVALNKLASAQAVILRRRYVDQLNDKETACAMEIRLPKPPFYDTAEARRLSIEAYCACAASYAWPCPANVSRIPARNTRPSSLSFRFNEGAGASIPLEKSHD